MLFTGIFFTIWGVKLLVRHHYSVNIPFEEEWDAEALGFFKAWEEGTLQFAHLFSIHNENRILITRVWSLMWLLINGQWSPQVVMTAYALLHSGFALVLCCLVQRSLTATCDIVFLIMAVIFIGLSYSTASIIAESQFFYSDVRNARHPAVAGYTGQRRASCVPFLPGPSANQNHSRGSNNIVTNRNYSPLNDHIPRSWSSA